MNHKKRILSAFLAFLMVAAMMPRAADATPIGGGALAGKQPDEVNPIWSPAKTRFNTTKLLEDGDKDKVQVQGDTRWANMDETRRMFEYDSGTKTLIVHGYGSTIGPASSITQQDQNPGTIGGGVITGKYRKSWLDGFYPYIYDGQINGPKKPDCSQYKNRANENLYARNDPISDDAIERILIDDLSTKTSGNVGLMEQHVHDSYDMYNDDYTSGLTEIAPYTFANLPNLIAIDFDASQIQKIGAYAFAGCQSLGSGTVDGFELTVNYSDALATGSLDGTETSRHYTNHNYQAEGCKKDCGKTGIAACTLSGSGYPTGYYKEQAGRILLPHNLKEIGEHAFQNCAAITEYMIHKDNQTFIASASLASWPGFGGNPAWTEYTDGVIYSKGQATATAIQDTSYTLLRAAVMSDYQKVPDKYKNFWRGPFGEREPMTLEWYVRSWNANDYSKKVLEVTKDVPGDGHVNWTDVEAAVDKAQAASGHVGNGTEVKTENNDWQANWTNYFDVNKSKYNDKWWSDDFFNSDPASGGAGCYGYDRKVAGTEIGADAKKRFDDYVKADNNHDFNTLFLYPEGKPDGTFTIYPGKDPATWETSPENSVTPVKVIAPFAFSNAKKLGHINMAGCNELTTFGQGTFLNCASLTTVTFPEAGYTTGTGTHVDSSIAPDLRKPNYHLTKLADDMFSQCRLLTTVNNLDRDYGGITRDLGDPEGDGVELNKLTESSENPRDTSGKKYRSTIREFGQNCFHKCLSLTESGFTGGFGLPDTLIVIGQSAFHTCKKLTSLTIHQNVEVIGDYAFSDCYMLSSIRFKPKQPTSGDEAVARDRIIDHRNDTAENKQRQFYISAKYTVGEEQTLQFGNKTFEHCSSLTRLQVGSTWLIQPTTFQHAIYITVIDEIAENGTHYPIQGYKFNNGSNGQGSSGSPDRVSGATGADESYFEDCAYEKGLHNPSGTKWVKKPS